MRRVVIVVAGSLLAAGCSSFSPGDLLPSVGGGYPLKLESDPPGAEAKTSLGPGCRTPCTIAVPARDDFSVTFALAGYQPQTLPVSVVRSDGFGSDGGSAMQLFPNPVEALLEPAPPAPVAKKKPKTKSKPAKAAAAKPAAAKPPATKRPAPSDGTKPAENVTTAQRVPGSAWSPSGRQ